MPPSYFPLRWESTGDQWWYASPIDWAAANGHFDLVLELLHIDPNLLIKLTSLRRIRRLETVWDDDLRFADVACCRSFVARLLLLECENHSGGNSLLRAGYGGWLLYTAASAGDAGFVKELLLRDPLMVFGEGEFGVTDILYAAARSKNSEVFRILFDNSVSRRCFSSILRQCNETMSVFQQEMLNRAVHAAARGGNLEVLRELLAGCRDVLVYRDAQGSTVLHAASGRGQVEVVKDLVVSFDIIDSIDNNGNTSLHIATFRGHLPVVEALIKASPSLIYLTNGTGDTFLHVAIAGFRTSGFRRLDRQMELVRHLISGALVNIEEIINCRNNDGRTILHMTVIGNVHPDLVALLMTIRSIDLNIKDINGMTPLDLLGQHPLSASSEMLIRQMISAGGVVKSNNHMQRSALASQLRMQGIGNSPGTTFKVSDAEIFLYTGIETSNSTENKSSGRTSSCSSISKGNLPHTDTAEETNASADKKRHSPLSNAANRLRTFIRRPCNKRKKSNGSAKMCDVEPMATLKKCSPQEEMPTSLRERFSKQTSLPNNKRTLAVRSSMPTTPSTKKKLAASLMHGVIETMPHLAPPLVKSPSCSSPRLSVSSTRQKNVTSEIETLEPSSSVPRVKPLDGLNDGTPQKSRPSGRHVNRYFCFGAQGLSVQDKVTGQRSSRFFRRSALSVS